MKNLSYLKNFRKNKFEEDIFWNYLSLVFLALSGIIINFIISINYSAEVLGVFNQVLAGYIVFAMIGSGGINYSVLRGIQSNINNQNEIRSIIAGAFLPTILFSSTVTLVYFLLIDSISHLIQSDNVAIGMRYITTGLFFFSINKVLIYGIINGLNRMKLFSLFQSLRYIFILISLIISIAYGFEGEKITLIFSVGEFALFLSLFTYLSFEVSWWKESLFNSWVLKHIKYGIKCLLGGMLIELNTRVDILMLGFFMKDDIVGIYSFAALFGEGFYQVLIVLQNIINPYIARQFVILDYMEFKKFFCNLRKNTYKYVLILCIFSILIYPKLIDTFTNKLEFNNSFIPFSILIVGITIASGYIPFYNIFSMANKPGIQSIFILMIFSTNIIANAIFIPLIGYYGAALGTALSFLSSIFYFKFLSKYFLGLKLI